MAATRGRFLSAGRAPLSGSVMPPAPRTAPAACRNERRERPSANDSLRDMTSPHLPSGCPLMVADRHATILHLLGLEDKQVADRRGGTFQSGGGRTATGLSPCRRPAP